MQIQFKSIFVVKEMFKSEWFVGYLWIWEDLMKFWKYQYYNSYLEISYFIFNNIQFFKMKGQSTLITVYGCDENLVRDKEYLAKFGKALCDVIRMKPFGDPLVHRFGKGKLEGYSMVQLIETSNITVHLDEFENKAFVDIFSCRPFISEKAADFSRDYFKGKDYHLQELERK